jgi:hypothetical protein
MAPYLIVNNKVLEMVMRVIFPLWKKERRRPDMVPKVGPNNNN